MYTIPLTGHTILSKREDHEMAIKIYMLMDRITWLEEVVAGYQKALDAATDIVAEKGDEDDKNKVLAVIGEHFDVVGE